MGEGRETQLGPGLNRAMFDPDGYHRDPHAQPGTTHPGWRVFHASSTAPAPQTAEGAVGEGWETQPGLRLNGAMFRSR